MVAEEFISELTQSVTLFKSGSTIFGDTVDDTHNVTGSLSVSSVSRPVGYFNISLPFAIGDGTDTAGRSCGAITVHNANAILSRDFVNIGVEGESAIRVYVGDASGLQSDSANGVIANTAIHVSITYHV